MAPECTFILPNGRKCRGNAIRNHELCRHHAPSPGGPPQASNRGLYSPLAKWRALGRSLSDLDPIDVPSVIYEILDSLTGRDPSERLSDPVAGRYLRALLSRLGEVPFPNPEAAERSVASVPPPAPARPSIPPGMPALSPEFRDALLAVSRGAGDPQALIALANAMAGSGTIPPEMRLRPSRI